MAIKCTLSDYPVTTVGLTVFPQLLFRLNKRVSKLALTHLLPDLNP